MYMSSVDVRMCTKCNRLVEYLQIIQLHAPLPPCRRSLSLFEWRSVAPRSHPLLRFKGNILYSRPPGETLTETLVVAAGVQEDERGGPMVSQLSSLVILLQASII